MTVLDEYMRTHGFSDEDIASKTGYSAKTIDRAKKGEGVHRSTLRSISLATGIPAQEVQKPIKGCSGATG